VRQVAWLRATPRTLAGKPGTRTRLDALAARHAEPDLPDAGPAAYLAGYLWDAGPTAPGFMAPTPLAWTELLAWQSATGVDLTPWELRTLRGASAEYLVQAQASEAHDCPPPYAPALPIVDRQKDVSARVGALFGAMARGKPSKRTM
jgi:hypothetical protein